MTPDDDEREDLFSGDHFAEAQTQHGLGPRDLIAEIDGPKVEAGATASAIDAPTDRIRAMTSSTGQSKEWRTKVTRVQAVKTRDRIEDGEAYLVLVYPPGQDMGRRFSLNRDEVVLGRGADCDIQVDRDSVSRRHARVFRSDGHWVCEDLGSTNGSYVNDLPVQRATLADNDFFKIGAAIFKFLVGVGVEASYYEEIYKMTIVDGLTGAHNKRYFLEFLDREAVRCWRHKRPLSLLLLDIDHFKRANDAHGNLTGDYVLKELSRRLSTRVRREELLARYGGEEFAVVLPETNRVDAMALAESLRRIVADEPFEYEGDKFTLTISIGVATANGADGLDVAAFIREADESLYRAKREGRDRVVGPGTPRIAPWPHDLHFRALLAQSNALIAVALAGRAVLMTRSGGGAVVDDLEGLCHAAFLAAGTGRLSFGRVEGEGTLLVAASGPDAARWLERLSGRIPGQLAAAVAERGLPEVAPIFGPAVVVEGSSDGVIARAVAGVVKAAADVDRGDGMPLPIAVAARAARSRTDVLARAMGLVTLHEAVVRWLTACVLAELRAARAGTETLRAVRQALIKPATLGTWFGLLRRAAAELATIEPVHASMWRALFLAKGQTGLLSTLSSFIDDRNELIHGGTADERTAREMVEHWQPRLDGLLANQLRFLLHLVPLEIVELDFDEEDDRFDYRVRRLVGDHQVLSVVPVTSQRRMKRGSMQLCDLRWDRALPLDPLALYEVCPGCGAREVFLLDRIGSDGSQLAYVSPASGHALEDGVTDARRAAVERFFAP